MIHINKVVKKIRWIYMIGLSQSQLDIILIMSRYKDYDESEILASSSLIYISIAIWDFLFWCILELVTNRLDEGRGLEEGFEEWTQVWDWDWDIFANIFLLFYIIVNWVDIFLGQCIGVCAQWRKWRKKRGRKLCECFVHMKRYIHWCYTILPKFCFLKVYLDFKPYL